MTCNDFPSNTYDNSNLDMYKTLEIISRVTVDDASVHSPYTGLFEQIVHRVHAHIV